MNKTYQPIWLSVILLIFSSCKKESEINIKDKFLFEANDYSWDGSWTPSGFPMDNMFDDVYKTLGVYMLDGNQPSPILPPGQWDSENSTSMANYRHFSSILGTFTGLLDKNGNQFGWKFERMNAEGVEVDTRMEYFEGSAGLNIIDLGLNGTVYSSGAINFGNGLTMLSFKESWSLDLRTGSSENENIGNDNDLVLIGSDSPLDADSFEINTTTVHTGPGSDLVFVNNIEHAAIDLGNGAAGRTDVIDGNDMDDMLIIDGNVYDSRFFGGAGNDIFIWYADNNYHSHLWTGSSFYGTGGFGEAQYTNDNDRLVMVIPDDTPLVGSEVGTTPNGSIKVWIPSPYPEHNTDAPTAGDVFARYDNYFTNSEGRRMVLFEYRKKDGSFNTGYMFLISVEEIQIGTGADARVYSIDDKNGVVAYNPILTPLYDEDIPLRLSYRNLFSKY